MFLFPAIRLQDLSITEDKFRRELEMKIEAYSIEIGKFNLTSHDLIEYCDDIELDSEKDVCFGEIHPQISEPKVNISIEIADLRQLSELVFTNSKETLSSTKSDILWNLWKLL